MENTNNEKHVLLKNFLPNFQDLKVWIVIKMASAIRYLSNCIALTLIACILLLVYHSNICLRIYFLRSINVYRHFIGVLYVISYIFVEIVIRRFLLVNITRKIHLNLFNQILEFFSLITQILHFQTSYILMVVKKKNK